MLKVILKFLHYPPTGVSSLIYAIGNDVRLRKELVYNPIGDYFEIPIEKLPNMNFKGYVTKELILGTPIYWGTNETTFYFGIDSNKFK